MLTHKRMPPASGWAIGLAGALLAACAPSAPPPEEHAGHDHAEKTGEAASAAFVNGDFEAGTHNQPPPSWTVTPYFNPNAGVTIQTPQTRAGLGLATTGNPVPAARTFTLVAAGGPESQTDPTLGTNASLRWPKFGNAVTVVNRQGDNHNANSMKQTMTIAAGDVDSVDGLAHVRFVIAPVLQDPGHPANEQPYFFVQLHNITKNQILYQDFNFANQPGVPWKSVTTGGSTYRYTDWALVDIAPGSGLLNTGDQVELEIIGSGCSLGGHWGHVYVDSVGPSVPGLFVSGTGPAAANQNTDITYTLTYKNGGAAGASGVVVEFNTPPDTTFTSFSAPGLACSAPTAGAAGLVSCTVGTLAAGASGSFDVTVHIDNGTAPGLITAGNYNIDSPTTSPLIGPKVYTTVTSGVAYADLGITVSNGVTQVGWGQPVSYTVVVTNDGPSAVSGATVTDPQPPNLTNMAWTCAGAGCAAPSGTGPLNTTVNLAAGASATYTVTGTVIAGSGVGALFNVATVAVPSGAVDPSPVNNSAGDSDVIKGANGNACAGDIECLSGDCSAGLVCIPAGGCAVDADCNTASQFCNTQTLACTPKLPNGTSIPTLSGHAPPLTGACNTAAGAAVCVSAVCDATDNACGYANGDGPCTTASAGTVCRSSACSVNGGVCIPAGGCAVDADCQSNQFCDTSVFACVPKLPNGTSIPTLGGHAPPLTGACNSAVGAAVCVAAVCDVTDNACGFTNGNGPCTMASAGTVCRSGVCSANGTCMAAGACNADADCAGGAWCNISAHACAPRIGNGGVMPTDPPHASPTLDGDCTASAATLVCVSSVCDAADDRCGFANGHGTCDGATAATVCRSAACDPDGKCGFANGHGPCTTFTGPLVCRSGECSPNGAVCLPVGGCAVDADCGASEWCHSPTFTCQPRLPNGDAIPTVAGHDPTLDGACTAGAGSAVCVSSVCDPGDDRCGLADGSGPCTAATGAVVCRSGACTASGVCGPATGCTTDSECDTATQFCDTAAAACSPKLPNGAALPTISGHTPTLDGTCDSTQAPIVCVSAVCDTQDDKCGYENGHGPCTVNDAGIVCRSSTCSPNGNVCIPSGGCAVDADCGATEWCHTELFACVAKLPNGAGVPTVAGHAPVLDGTCTTAVGAGVCASAVCDPSDDKCGYASGNGPCTMANAGTVCREGACTAGGVCTSPVDCQVDADCDTQFQYCDTGVNKCSPKLPNGALMPGVAGHSPALDGTCSDTAAQIVCQSGVCDPEDNKCGHENGQGPCTASDGATVCRSAICAVSGPHAGLCVECVADTACEGSQAVCDTSKNECVQCTPAEDAACTGATPVCVAGPGTCAPCDGDLGSAAARACTDSAAPYCFLAGPNEGECGKCSVDADCAGHPGGSFCDAESGACVEKCQTDADCAATEWCNAPAGGGGSCVPKLDNGEPLPASPTEVSTCSTAVGARVCKSGVCDVADDKCGLVNGSGPCTDGTTCRSGACDASDSKCGLLDGKGPCSTDEVCRAAHCDTASQLCAPDGCTSDGECPATDYCAADGECTPKHGDGEACGGDNQCKSDTCRAEVCDSIVGSGNGVICAARPTRDGSGEGAAMTLIGLALAGLARRRRR